MNTRKPPPELLAAWIERLRLTREAGRGRAPDGQRQQAIQNLPRLNPPEAVPSRPGYGQTLGTDASHRRSRDAPRPERHIWLMLRRNSPSHGQMADNTVDTTPETPGEIHQHDAVAQEPATAGNQPARPSSALIPRCTETGTHFSKT